MDKRILKYIKDKKSVPLIAAVLGLGLLLIFLGTTSESRGAESVATMEERIGEACASVAGVGECRVFIYYDEGDVEKVESVIVICDGAESVDVRYRLTEMLSSFFGIGANRIRIEKRVISGKIGISQGLSA